VTRHHSHHAQGSQGPGGHDDLERRLAAALDQQAALAPDAETVRRAAVTIGARRRRRRRASAVVAVLAVAGLGAASLPLVDDLLGRGSITDVGVAGRTTSAPGTTTAPTTAPTTGPSPEPSPGPSPWPSQDLRPSSSSEPLPWTVPGDEAPLVDGPAATAAVSQAAVDAFDDAGYSSADAAALARLWGRPDDPTAAASAAGTRLLDGQNLPFAAGEVPTDTHPHDLLQAFTGAGHDVDDALDLARLWDLPSGYQAVQRAGQMITAGTPLPEVDATRDTTTATGEDPAVLAFDGDGLEYDDAEQLAALWSLPSPLEAKVAAGSNLLAGQPVPLQP